MCYVDDLLVVGEQPDHIMALLQKEFLLKETSRLQDGERAEFLGRTIRRDGDNYVLGCKGDYINDILRTMNMLNCKGSTTPGTTALQKSRRSVTTPRRGREALPKCSRETNTANPDTPGYELRN